MRHKSLRGHIARKGYMMPEDFDYMGRIQKLGETVYSVVVKLENKALFEFLRDTNPEEGFMWLEDSEWPTDALKQYKTIENELLADEGFTGAAYGYFMRNLQYRIRNEGAAPVYTD
jgi:hypothetical protein